MACRAGRNCITKLAWAKVYLGKSDVRPPAEHFHGLIRSDGTEVTGPSYSRQRIRFTRAEKGGYANDAPLSVRPVHVDEDWGVVSHTLIAFSATPTEGECTCFAAPMDRARRIEAGDILKSDRGDLRVRLGGRITSHAAQTMEDFIFGGIDLAPPRAFFAGLFAAKPDRLGQFVEVLSDDYKRVPIRFKPGRDGITPYVGHDVKWTSTGGWDVAGLGIFDTDDPYDPDGRLWSWRPMPYGGRVVEAGDEVVQLAGTWGLA